MKNVPSIEEYIAGFPKEIQLLLNKMRALIWQSAPDAREVILYAMPTFRLEGNLVLFAAYKQHIGFYPAPSAINAFAEELKGYPNSKGADQFPLDKPLPEDLIQRIVKFRVEENTTKATSKKLLRTCKLGHKYHKTSNWHTCPICEQQQKPDEGFMAQLGAPARRALEREGIQSLEQLVAYSVTQLPSMLGLGKSTIPKLNATLIADSIVLKK